MGIVVGKCIRDHVIADLPPCVCYMHERPPVMVEEPISVRIYNTFPRRLNIYWDNGRSGVYSGYIDPGDEFSTTSYVTHRFLFKDEKGKMWGDVTMVKERRYYFIGPGVTEDMQP